MTSIFSVSLPPSASASLHPFPIAHRASSASSLSLPLPHTPSGTSEISTTAAIAVFFGVVLLIPLLAALGALVDNGILPDDEKKGITLRRSEGVRLTGANILFALYMVRSTTRQ